ncbi:hypothetical protein ACROYT_G016715 [Oculina patagonica]
MKTAEDTQTLTISLTEQMRRRGIPTRPDIRSESANEARNMFVIVLSVFFLWIKAITRPLTAIISRPMMHKSTMSGEGRSEFSESGSVSLLDVFPKQLALHLLSDAIVSPEQRFFLMSIVNSISTEWRALAKASGDESLVVPLPNSPTIKLENDNSVPILDVSSKQVYQSFIEKKQIPPSAKMKLADKYPDTIVDWEKVYSLAFCTTLESKIREFQYKVLNYIVYTNEKLFRLGIVDSSKCTFCQKEAESIEHLLFFCAKSSESWIRIKR